MSSFKRSPTKLHSRVKNYLAELQRWWPIHIKNDGVHGITVNPVLYKTEFGICDKVGDESQTAGIRVESINDDGTESGYPTIVISGSGTWGAKCTITHADSSSTEVDLVSHSAVSGEHSQTNVDGSITTVTTTFGASDGGNVMTTGQYPVMMTVQELAEMIDTYRHVGNSDSDKGQFDPHGGASLITPFPADSPYRATVFMPMMLDVNQFSKDISGATNTFSGHGYWNPSGITRYPGDPVNKPSNIKFKILNKSGDHLLSTNYASQMDFIPAGSGQSAVWMSQDSTHCPSPKYRMKMALACFLKDGTYSLNDGVLIPYTYDSSRYIGGTVTDTLYTVWNGADDVASGLQGGDHPAGIYPYFDFVQGPFAPAAQGSNWTNAVLADHTVANHALRYEVPPNPCRMKVLGIEFDTTGTAFGKHLIITVQHDTPVITTQIPKGQPIYLTDMDGILGTDSKATLENSKIWESRFDSRRDSTKGAKDCNGWWIVHSCTDLGLVDPDTVISGIAAEHFGGSNSVRSIAQYKIILNGYSMDTAVSAYVVSDGAMMSQGRTGGPEIGFATVFAKDANTGIPIEGPIDIHAGATTNDSAALNIWYPEKTKFVDETENVLQSTAIGTGFQAGMNQGDNNVPPASSANDTYPARPSLGELSVSNVSNQYVDNRPVSRGIHIQTLNSAPKQDIPSAPPVFTKDGGSLRIPPPLGHDICMRYNNVQDETVLAGHLSNNWENNNASRWVFRSDISNHAGNTGAEYNGGPDRWAWRGVSTPLWSYMCNNTGRHAWDYVLPTGVSGDWTYGRNRPYPAHERMGTRLSMSPSLSPDAGSEWIPSQSRSNDYSVKGNEETRYGVSEMGCSPIFLDMEMTAFIPSKPDRMTIIEFDMNEVDPKLGRHHMIYSLGNKDMGFGFRPEWNGLGLEGVYRRGGFVTSSGSDVTIEPRSGGVSSAGTTFTGIDMATKDAFDTSIGDGSAVAGGQPTFAGFAVDSRKAMFGSDDITAIPTAPHPVSSHNNRPAVWFTASAPHFTAEGWANTDGLTIPSTGGFGRLGTGYGHGDSFGWSEGTNTIRTTFHAGGMGLSINGAQIGTDTSATEPVWGMQVKSCQIMTFPHRTPFVISGTKVFPRYAHLETEEPIVLGTFDGTPTSDSRFPIDAHYYEDPPAAAVGTVLASVDDYFPSMMPVQPSTLLDAAGRMTRADNPALQVSNVDLSIDSLTMRQIPSPAMLPFTVDTTNNVVTGVDIAKYTSLSIEADNINTSKGMKVTISICEPPTNTTIAQEASTVVSGFDNIDPQFIGGVGAVDLSGLPASVVLSGFVVRFNFFVPSSEDTSLHPIDWDAVPIIRSWQVYYDHKPTSEATVIGNTYDGSTATTIGTSGVQTLTTKVGHIISLRMSGDTTDLDRTMEYVKADFGDGTVTDWFAVETPEASITYDISHVYSDRPAGGSYDILVYAKDDNGNVTLATDPLRVTIVAAEPVAVIRAIPSMVRAGQPIRFDASGSYSVDTNATLSTFTWEFGDGSSSVSGPALYQDHTYAQAGEFMATVSVVDSLGITSPIAKSVVKVLPATLVVPLTLSTRPSGFSRSRSASLTRTPILDAVYPEVSDMGQRGDEFSLKGMFLKETADTDIAFMEELLLSGSLVEFEWQDVNFVGVPDSKTFVGRMTSFNYNRDGGATDRTPYSATFVREAGLGS